MSIYLHYQIGQDMDSKSFCHLLREARKISGVSMPTVTYILQKTQTSVERMLRCENDNGMWNIIAYISAIRCEICLGSNNQQMYAIFSRSSLRNWIKLAYGDQSTLKLAAKFGISHQTAGRILKGEDVRLSTFLKMVDDQGLTIHIQPNDIGGVNDASNDCDIE